ncbi:hypothetical protein LXL04_015841 [Taraxacum kok-saghyz]
MLFGDFKAVRNDNERHGTRFCPLIASDFNEFIYEAGLVDIPMGGKRYTRVDSYCGKMSRLDRFLVSEQLFDVFPELQCIVLMRRWSNHCPLLLQELNIDYGPTSFKLFSSCMEITGFDDVVKKACIDFIPILGTRSQNVVNRQEAVDRLVVIDREVDDGEGSEVVMAERRELLEKVADIDRLATMDIM